VDFLTAPLLTLGIPLVYLMLLQTKEYKEASCRNNLLTMAVASVTWLIGYLGNWFSKWVLASLVLKRDIITEGVLQGVTRMGGGSQMESNRAEAIALNMFAILPPGITSSDWGWFKIVLLTIAVIAIVLLVRFHGGKNEVISQIPFLLAALYPYVWYCVLANHSQIHYIFTYRAQMITVWAGLIAFSGCLDMKKIKAVICSSST